MYRSVIQNKDLVGSWLVSYFESKENRKNSRFADWVPLEDLVEIHSGLYIRGYCHASTPGAESYYRVDNVRDFVPNLTAVDIVHADMKKSKVPERCRIQVGDVVIARTGTLGKAFLATKEHKGGVLSQHLTRLKVINDLITPEYLCAFLNSPLGREQLISFGSGSTRLELTHDNLKQLEVPIPKTSTVIKSLSKKLQEALSKHASSSRSFGQAIDLLEKELPPMESSQSCGLVKNSELSNLWTPRFLLHEAAFWENTNLGDFEVRPFDEIAKIERGKGTRVSQYTVEGVPFIRTSSLINHGLDYFPDHFTDEGTYKSFKQPIEENDIIVSMEGKIGAVALLNPQWPIVFKNHIERARLYDSAGVEPEFIFSLLNTKQYQAMIDRRVVVQATIPGMSNRLRSLPVVIGSKKHGKKFLDTKKQVVQYVRRGQKDRCRAYELLSEVRASFQS